MDLYPHNKTAYEAVMKHFNEGNRKAAVIQSTGTGKSFVGGAVSSHFEKVLVVAPNEYVLSQAVSVTPHADTATYSLLAMREDVPTGYDLIWFDEFHRIGAPTWKNGVDKVIEANPQAKILGTTATPDRSLENRNMADEFFEGDVVSNMTLTDAWVNHILRVPKYVIGVVSMNSTQADYAERINSSTRIDVTQKKEATALLNNIVRDWSYSYGVPRILKKYIDKDVERMIVFAQTISKLDEVVSSIRPWFEDAGIKLANVYTVHSDMGIEAKRQMQAFENDTTEGVKVLVSVNMLNEGIHVNRVDAVMLLRSTISKNLYMQQIGRCFAVGQKHQPIILDLADNLTSACGYEGMYDAQRIYLEGTSTDKEKRTPDEFMVIDTLKETREVIAMIEKSFALNSWTPESCAKEALKYNTRSDFMKGSGSAYQYAAKHGIMDEICSHMVEKIHKWTKEECHAIAFQYKTKIEFRKANGAAYHYAEKKGFLNEICSHMTTIRCKWDKDNVLAIARTCTSRKEFSKNYHGAYKYALLNNLNDELDKIFGEPSNRPIDEAYVREMAKKHTSLRELRKEDERVYIYALNHKINKEIFAHLKKR